MTMSEFEEWRNNQATPAIIIPISPLEEHASHLQLDCDVSQSTIIAERVAKTTGCLLFPPIHLGICGLAAAMPGTVSVSYETLRGVVADVCRELARNGLVRIVIYSAHGGTQHVAAIQAGVQSVQRDYPDVQFFIETVWSTQADVIARVIETKPDSHAGEHETSEMLYLAPEEVRHDRLPGLHQPTFPRRFTRAEECVTFLGPGYIGDPSKATVEKGHAVVERTIEILTGLITSD